MSTSSFLQDDQLVSARPFPAELDEAARRVAADFGLSPGWLNPGPTALLEIAGLPPGFVERLTSRTYGPALTVSFASRFDQVHLKLETSSGPARRGHAPTTLRARSTISSRRRWRSSELRMSVASLREEAAQRARDFAWDQWIRLGVSGPRPRDGERRAIDPEALLLFTFEAARDDPRLFDEVLDWLVLNEQLVSVQRLRNLCLDDEDRLLVGASLRWVAQRRPRQRLTGRPPTSDDQPARLLFPGLSRPSGAVDEAFAAFGFLRSRVEPSGKSQRPNLHEPIAFALRLRRLLGVGVRAELVRALLTVDAPRVSAGVLNASAGFTRQNVRESLQQLAAADVLRTTRLGTDQFFALRRDDWAQLLGLSEHGLPLHRDWIQTLGPLRLILRWLGRSEVGDLSEYMRASEARQLMAGLEQDIRFAGVTPGGGASQGAAYWDEFVEAVQALVASLQS
jgi:hypothetical protein